MGGRPCGAPAQPRLGLVQPLHGEWRDRLFVDDVARTRQQRSRRRAVTAPEFRVGEEHEPEDQEHRAGLRLCEGNSADEQLTGSGWVAAQVAAPALDHAQHGHHGRGLPPGLLGLIGGLTGLPQYPVEVCASVKFEQAEAEQTGELQGHLHGPCVAIALLP